MVENQPTHKHCTLLTKTRVHQQGVSSERDREKEGARGGEEKERESNNETGPHPFLSVFSGLTVLRVGSRRSCEARWRRGS